MKNTRKNSKINFVKSERKKRIQFLSFDNFRE